MRLLLPCLLALCLTACISLPALHPSPPLHIAFDDGVYLSTSPLTFGKFSFLSPAGGRTGRATEPYRFTLEVGPPGHRVRARGGVVLGPEPRRRERQTWVDLVPDPPFRHLAFPRRLYLVETADGYLALSTQLGSRPLWQAAKPLDYE